MSEKLLSRDEVPEELTWDLTDLFSDDEQWEKALQSLAEDLEGITTYRGRLDEGAGIFLECLKKQERLTERLMRVGSYAGLKLAADGTSQQNQTQMGRISALRSKFSANSAFIRSEALNLPDGTLERYMQQEPELESFRPFIRRLLDFKPHTLQPETESVLASLSEVLDAPSNIYRRAKTTDMKFEPAADSDGSEVPVTFSAYEGRYERSPDTTLRRSAFSSFTEGLSAYQNTFGTSWGTEVRKNVVMADNRGFSSAVHMLLQRQEVPLQVYNDIHDIILGELAPHMRRYARLRKDVVGLDKMLYCDIEVPLDPEYQPQISYEEASELISGGLAVLGDEYRGIIDAGLTDRWIDLAENAGKSTGAFCNSVYGVHPYILITWTGSMRNALTLAHELGHAGHGVMAQRTQRLTNCRASMFFIEAPSTVNELLVGEYIMQQSGDDVRMKRWVVEQLLMTYHHNFVRHLIEGELQRRIYALAEEGQPVNAGVLSRVQGEILDEFWGGEVEIDEGARLTWMRQPHYYRGLYPYSYAAGLTIGTAVAEDIRTEGRPAAERWLEVLQAGGTKKPLQLAQMAGVDMSSPEAIRRAVQYVGSLVDDMQNSY